MFFNDSGYQQPLYQNDDNTDISAAVETPSGRIDWKHIVVKFMLCTCRNKFAATDAQWQQIQYLRLPKW